MGLGQGMVGSGQVRAYVSRFVYVWVSTTCIRMFKDMYSYDMSETMCEKHLKIQFSRM